MNLTTLRQYGFPPNIRHQLRSFFSLYPELFYPIVNLKSSKKLAVDDCTEIVIEGFPRSGNSYSVGAFESAQNRQVKIAHHLHAPAQIISASRKNIPTILLIRNPTDAIISLKALDLEIHYLDAPRNIKPAIIIQSYIDFYEKLIPYSDCYIVSLFDTTIKDFDTTIEKVNKKFKTNFEMLKSNTQNAKNVFSKRGFHAGPSAKRQKIKERLYEEFQSDRVQKLIKKADSIYSQFVSISQNQ